MPQALLLELDTLVVGALGARRDALVRALAEQHPAGAGDDAARPVSPVVHVRVATLTALDAARALVAPADGSAIDETAAELLALRASRHYRAWLAQGVTLERGAVALVADAASRGRVAVVTRGTRDEAAYVLALAGLDDAVACVVAAEDVRAGKPSADGHRLALGRLARHRVTAADALAIDDSVAGLRAARESGVAVIAVGALPPHEAAEADAFVESLDGHTMRTLGELAAPAARRSA